MTAFPWTRRAPLSLFAGLALPLWLLAPPAVRAQPIAAGAAYLEAVQEVDGGWSSGEVRRQHATSEALRALAAVALAPGARLDAADLLETAPVEDTDDRARRTDALAAEGRDVAAARAALVADAAAGGGWGLTAGFVADPLDTALALVAVASQPPADPILLPALSTLLAAQRGDGGWPCIDAREDDAASEIFCTSYALLALTPYRGRFFLDPEIDAGAAFLGAARNADGSFGPAGGEQVIHTALAALALAAIPAFGAEVANVIAFLEGRQAADGSWDGDPYPTALALRALGALAGVPFCGNGGIDQPGEACDGADLGGLACEDLGLGAGTLACSAQCTFDTSACSAAPVCGDDLRNQPFEICDGLDLAGESCESLGFASGALGCAADCTSFDVSSCNAAAACGDGVINLPGELCDLSDLGGTTCESLGLGGGLLACANDCSFDTSQCDTGSFEIDNKGREFFVGFMNNFDSVGTAAVHLTSDVATTATIQYPAVSPSFVQTVDVDPGAITIVNLPRSAYTGWGAGTVTSNAVRVSAPDELVVYLVNRRPFSSDAGMALPVDALGTSYLVTTATGSTLVSSDRSQFLVVAPFDNTTVTITPTTSLRIEGVTYGAGTPATVTLDRGEGVRGEALFARTDLTGTAIESDRPVAVVNGNRCTNVPSNVAFCDHIFEVAHPVRSWGNTALVANLPNRALGVFYRVVASEDGTEVSLDGAPQAVLDRGQLLELGPLAGNHVFAADKPIFVTQFMTGSRFSGATLGDPAMANMIPPDQYLSSYTFSTVGSGQFSSHFLTLIAPDGAIPSLLLDGVAVDPAAFTPVDTSGFSAAVISLPEGSHTTASSEPHGITVEGINRDDSYIYPGGAQLAFINQFCGDGSVNQPTEACDGNDFAGATCASFGFSAGFLQCTGECQVDTSQCSGIGNEDEDSDGFPATEDCDDTDPAVNPGMTEIPGNGIDDDCNPATPDEIPDGAVACAISADSIAYFANEVVGLEARVENGDELLSLTGLIAALSVVDGGGGEVFADSRPLAPLPPGARALQSWAFPAAGLAPGAYTATLALSATGAPAASCQTAFAVEVSAGTGLGGTLSLDPELVNAGEPSDATYTIENLGNVELDLAIRVILIDPDSGGVVAELLDAAVLAPGASVTATQPFATGGLESNRTYIAVLLATPAASAVEQTLDNARLTVVNAPPECGGAVADPDRLWPPNHKYRDIEIEGVTDPDGDPVTLTVVGVLQDEPIDGAGDGNTCPDAEGVGSARARVRAERSGREDGRVYHLFFRAEDGRGGTCEGEVTVCVPHDRHDDCVDQGAIFDSTDCSGRQPRSRARSGQDQTGTNQ